MMKRILGIFMAVIVGLSFINTASAEQDNTVSYDSKVIATETSITAYNEYLSNSSNAFSEQSLTVYDGNSSHLCFNKENSVVTFDVATEKTALYEMVFFYKPQEGKGEHIELSMKIDGEFPYNELKNLVLPRLWKDDGNKRTDGLGNETSAKQVEAFVWSEYRAYDSTGIIIKPLLVELTEGSHKITLTNENNEPFLLKSFVLAVPKEEIKYEEYIKDYKNTNVSEIFLEAENAKYKTENSLIGKAERNSAAVSPSSYCLDKVNYIGSSNWAQSGQKISWDVKVEKSGWYKVGFHYKQDYVLNGNSYRRLTVDGNVPFAEAGQIAFGYNTDWELFEYQNSNGKPYLIYLDEGNHTLELEVTLGPMASIYNKLSGQVEVLGSIYRKMVMIMGQNPDINRDYDLFQQISNLEEMFENSYKVLGEIKGEICNLTGKKSDSNTVVIDSMRDSIKKFLENPYRTQKYKDDYYNNYCSLGAILSEMVTMPLDLDFIVFLPENNSIDEYNISFIDKMSFSIKRFFSTFSQDYSSVLGNTVENNKKISIWLYWGKDQVQVLNNLIKEDFTPEHKIQVDIKITNSSLIQALLCDDTPDVYLRHDGLGTINMSMRGALYDLKNFDDFEEMKNRFMDYSFIPYNYSGGCYALPDTETYNMLFYRTDIFEEYNLEAPKTWDEFLEISTFFFHNNLQIGMPNAFNSFATFLYQRGGNIYNEDLSQVIFSDNNFVETFSYYTDFYKEYGFELTYDFYNRFRTGEMPMGVADYGQYNVLKVSAPEIDGKWAMAMLPGTEIDGEIVRTGVAVGTGSSIINKSNNKEAAWEFLKWWTSDEVQKRFSNECESVLGPSARQQTANVSALSKLSWDDNDLNALLEQWKVTKTIPQIPGGYYTERMFTQAFWSVVNNGTNCRNTLIKWERMANQEIARKRAEYKLD